MVDSLLALFYVEEVESRYVSDSATRPKLSGAASPEEAAGKENAAFYPDENAAFLHSGVETRE